MTERFSLVSYRCNWSRQCRRGRLKRFAKLTCRPHNRLSGFTYKLFKRYIHSRCGCTDGRYGISFNIEDRHWQNPQRDDDFRVCHSKTLFADPGKTSLDFLHCSRRSRVDFDGLKIECQAKSSIECTPVRGGTYLELKVNLNEYRAG